MSDDDEIDVIGETITWVNFKFKSIRIVGNAITSHNTTVKAELLVDDDTTEQDVSIALEKIHFWFTHILPSCLIFNRDNLYALNVIFDEEGVQQSSNFPMALPEDPTDDFLALVLHSKLNALAGRHIVFGMIELQSDTREMLACTFTGYGEFLLPDMEEWVGPIAYHEKPWWARDDGSTIDVIPGPDADLAEPIEIGVDLSFIENRFKQHANQSPVIIRPSQFTPQIIKGGLEDDPKS